MSKPDKTNAVFKTKFYFFDNRQKRRLDAFLQESKHATQFYIDSIWFHLESLISQEVYLLKKNTGVQELTQEQLKTVHSKIIQNFKANDYLTNEYLEGLIRIEKFNKEFKKYKENENAYLQKNPQFLQSKLYTQSHAYRRNNHDKTTKTRLGNRSASQCLKKAIEMVEGTLKSHDALKLTKRHHHKKDKLKYALPDKPNFCKHRQSYSRKILNFGKFYFSDKNVTRIPIDFNDHEFQKTFLRLSKENYEQCKGKSEYTDVESYQQAMKTWIIENELTHLLILPGLGSRNIVATKLTACHDKLVKKGFQLIDSGEFSSDFIIFYMAKDEHFLKVNPDFQKKKSSKQTLNAAQAFSQFRKKFKDEVLSSLPAEDKRILNEFVKASNDHKNNDHYRNSLYKVDKKGNYSSLLSSPQLKALNLSLERVIHLYFNKSFNNVCFDIGMNQLLVPSLPLKDINTHAVTGHMQDESSIKEYIKTTANEYRSDYIPFGYMDYNIQFRALLEEYDLLKTDFESYVNRYVYKNKKKDKHGEIKTFQLKNNKSRKETIETKEFKLKLERKLIATRNNLIDKIAKSIDYENLDIIGLENLKGLKLHKKTRRVKGGFNLYNRMGQWVYSHLRSRIEMHAVRRGVFVKDYNPSYTSLKCPSCGYTHASNRSKRYPEVFSCKAVSCETEGHADFIAANNAQKLLFLSLLGNELSGML